MSSSGKLRSLLEEFKAFALRGNIVDLAVAVVIGVAFNAVVTAFTQGILTAFIAAVFGEPSFDSIIIEIGDGAIRVGEFLNALVNFLIVAASLFVLLKLVSEVTRKRDETETETEAKAPAPSDEVVLLREIRDLLREGAAAGEER